MNQDDELNEMFREGLTEPGHHAEYREADWDALEEMLDGRKKRGIVFWLPYVGSAAAVLLVFFAWMFFKPAGDTGKPKSPVVVNKVPVTAPIITQPASPENTNASAVTTSDNNVAKNSAPSATGDKPQVASNSNTNQTRVKHLGKRREVSNTALNGEPIAATRHSRKVKSDGVGNVVKDDGQSTKSGSQTEIAAVRPEKIGNETETAVAKPEGTNGSAQVNSNSVAVVGAPKIAPPANDTAVNAKEKPQIAKAAKPELKTTSPSKGVTFALSILAAPQLNGVGSLSQTQTGADVGLLFSVGKGRFTLSTGAMYAKAPYQTDFSNYHLKYSLYTDPQTVNADCRILDIPINLHYQVLGNFKNKFSAGAGLSSYLMLSEDYWYSYAVAGTAGPTGYSATGRYQHYFGVLDLDILYQHRLSSKFSLDLQPYLKLPLTEIGYGRVNLQSTGLAVGFSWNIK